MSATTVGLKCQRHGKKSLPVTIKCETFSPLIHHKCDCALSLRVARSCGPGELALKDRWHWKFTALVVLTAMVFVATGTAHGQEMPIRQGRSTVTHPTVPNLSIIVFFAAFSISNHSH